MKEEGLHPQTHTPLRNQEMCDPGLERVPPRGSLAGMWLYQAPLCLGLPTPTFLPSLKFRSLQHLTVSWGLQTKWEEGSGCQVKGVISLRDPTSLRRWCPRSLVSVF